MTGRIQLPDVPELEFAPEPPPHGPVVWAKNNLFSTWYSVLLTIGGLLVIWIFLKAILGFIFDYDARRWDAVTFNARFLMVQFYPTLDRIWISIGIVVTLAALSLAFWRAGGYVAPRRLTRGLMRVGGFILFVIVGIAVIDYILGIIFGFDFGGFSFQFSAKVSWIAIAVAAGLFASGWVAERALGDRGKETTISTMAILGAAVAAIVGLLWIIQLPVEDGDPDSALKVFEPIASSTTGPWTILAGAGVLAYLLGLWLRRIIPQRIAKGALTGLWLLSFPVITLAIINDPGFGGEFAPKFELTTYLVIGAAFLVLGGFAIAAASHPSVGEWSAVISGVIAVAVLLSWAVAMLMVIRFLLILLLLFVLGAKTFGGAPAARVRYLLGWASFLAIFLYFFILAQGGSSVPVPTESPFGGLVLTFVIFIAVMLLSFPLGVLLALGRTSTMPIFRLMSVAYIEVIRAVPLITWLFMAVIFLPFALPTGVTYGSVIRVIVFYGAFSAAYMAENVRGGLQAVSAGQQEGAKAVGMTTVQTAIFITLPQALRAVIPALVGQAIATFKDTSLVTIVGLFDFLHIARDSIPGQTQFIGSLRTTLIVAAVVYWIFTFSMSRASQRLEKKLGVGEH